MAAIYCDTANEIEPIYAKFKLGNVKANSMIDSRFVVSLITKTLANKILRTTPSAKWVTTKQNSDLKTFSNEPIRVLGQLATVVTYNDWTYEDAHLTVVEDGHRIIIGRDLFNSLGLAVVQQQAESDKCIKNISNCTCKIIATIASHIPNLVSRSDFSKTHVAKSNFHQKLTAKHQKSQCVPINLQPMVTAELD